jgi:ubiquinone biosynthesis protein
MLSEPQHRHAGLMSKVPSAGRSQMPRLTGTAQAWLSLLREEIASSDLLPKAYARYRPLLADAFCFFLARISAVRLEKILSRQMQLAASASTAQRVVSLLEQLPALHKLGQVLARDRRLNARFRGRLQQLESLAPQIPMAQVVSMLGKAIKSRPMTGIELAPEPLAEGSVAVIMPFVWRDAPGGPRHGVFKLLKPEIRAKLEEDLEILSQLGGFLDEGSAQLHLPALDYRDTFDTIRDLLLHEVRFEEEQRNLTEAAGMYGGIENITVPGLLPFCSAKVTAMERLFGDKILGNGLSEPSLREPTARTICRALIATPIFASESAALFHADPHAGNLLMTPDGRVGILDWSLTGRLNKGDRIALVQILLAALALNVERMDAAVERLTCNQFDRPVARRILQARLNELRRGALLGINWLTAILDQLVLEAGLRLQPNLLLFRKSLLTLEGVVADVIRMKKEAANALLEEVVLGGFMQRWLLEWPRRFYVPFDDRSFSTHISVSDLVGQMLCAPATFARWWSHTQRHN